MRCSRFWLSAKAKTIEESLQNHIVNKFKQRAVTQKNIQKHERKTTAVKISNAKLEIEIEHRDALEHERTRKVCNVELQSIVLSREM